MPISSLPLAPSRKERVLHAVTTHLHINLQEDRSGFGLFGRHSYTTVLVIKILNVGDIRSNHNPIYLGNTVQWSHKGEQVVGEFIIGGEDGEEASSHQLKRKRLRPRDSTIPIFDLVMVSPLTPLPPRLGSFIVFRDRLRRTNLVPLRVFFLSHINDLSKEQE